MWRFVLLWAAVASATAAAASPSAPAEQTPAAKASFPDTPAGNAFRTWLDAFNSQDRAVYGDYITQHSPVLVKYLQDDYRFALLTGGFALVSVGEGSELELTGLLAEPYADFLTRFAIKLDPAPPHAILELELGPAERPADLPLPVLDEKALLAALEQRLDAQSADGRFSGVVLVARGGRVLFQRSYGWADVAAARRNTLDTRFRIASMGKMFTATAVMKLSKEGKLALQAPLAHVLPDYPNAAIAQNVTLHHLLTHTGGTGELFVPEIEDNREKVKTHADFVTLLGDRAPEFPAGAEWSYSNYGYVLLGRAIERASGENYFDYVRRHVFAPAGMRQSGTPPLARGTAPLALGYTRSGDTSAWTVAENGMPDVPTSAGGDLSTARDLYRFARALQKGTLLDEADIETLTRGKVDAPFGSYAYGFKDQSRDGLRYIGHGGGAPGSNNQLDLYPDSGHIVVVLTNQDPPYGNRIADFIGNRLAVAASAAATNPP